MLTPTVRRTFAPRGKTSISKSWDRHDRFSAIGAVTIGPRSGALGLYFRLLPDNATPTARTLWRSCAVARSHPRPDYYLLGQGADPRSFGGRESLPGGASRDRHRVFTQLRAGDQSR